VGGPQLLGSLVDGVATAAQFFDSLFCERDDWMVRVVMLFKAERLAVEGGARVAKRWRANLTSCGMRKVG
jgi:hypothetical protein